RLAICTAQIPPAVQITKAIAANTMMAKVLILRNTTAGIKDPTVKAKRIVSISTNIVLADWANLSVTPQT
ncbi:unnamed protein product, partial [marine sediment metagenome]